ncbi:hypothetical protein MKX01_018511 [Papaver californicum]|nr:hypothetical protein MKX01_018511 [Papaver californicum]
MVISCRILKNMNRFNDNKYSKRGFYLWSECYADLRCTTNQPSHIGTVHNEFEDETRMAPNFVLVGEIKLGLRAHDVIHDWSESFSRYPSINDDRRFVHTLGLAEQEGGEEYLPIHPDVPLISLSRQQKTAHDMVLQSMEAGSTICLIVSGRAGTGKSTLINDIVQSTRQLLRKNKAVRIMTPTGVAAFNIGGATIHHELAIAVDRG